MSIYYDNLLKHYQGLTGNSTLTPQKTPDQIAQEREAQMYQVFLTTKEGSDAMAMVKSKFNEWYSANYGIKQPEASQEVKDMKEMMAKMAAQIETLSAQLK